MRNIFPMLKRKHRKSRRNDETKTGRVAFIPLRHELLHPSPVHLGDVNRPARIDAEHVWHLELAWPRSLLAPPAQHPAVEIEDLHPVGPPVRYEHPVLRQE